MEGEGIRVGGGCILVLMGMDAPGWSVRVEQFAVGTQEHVTDSWIVTVRDVHETF